MRKLFLIALLMLTGCAGLPDTLTDTPSFQSVKLPDQGEAPELTNEIWLNIDTPLRLANLRGKVVLLDMWTFG